MKPIEELTYLSQVRRLRALAYVALEEYQITDAGIKLIAHIENTTFRVDVKGGRLPDEKPESPYISGRFLLRLHCPEYQTIDSVRSEAYWLNALSNQSDISVPAPIKTKNGEIATEIQVNGTPDKRVCSLLKWVDGRFYEEKRADIHFIRLGGLIARLHNFTENWKKPAGFTRLTWDAEGLFGAEALGFGDVSSGWDKFTEKQNAVFTEVEEWTRSTMNVLGRGKDCFGLIHGDLNLGNVLFSGEDVRPIDFDDCGYGYHLYDPAVLLYEYIGDDNWRKYRDLMIEGYNKHRTFPEKQINYLPIFMAARLVGIILWCQKKAETNPSFREWLPDYTEKSAMKLEAFLAKELG